MIIMPSPHPFILARTQHLLFTVLTHLGDAAEVGDGLTPAVEVLVGQAQVKYRAVVGGVQRQGQLELVLRLVHPP